MSYVNTARQSKLYIDGVEETARMISWRASDSSEFNNGFVLTTGEVVLGTNKLSQFTYQKQRYKRGAAVILSVKDPDTSTYVRHPRGLLYVSGEVFDPASQTVKISLACKLAMYAMIDDASAVLPLSPLTLDKSRQTFDNVRNAFAATGKILYQDNLGNLKEVDAFDFKSARGSTTAVPANWSSISDETVLTVSPLREAAPIPDAINLSYEFSTKPSDDDPAEIISEENTSTYDVKYPGVIYARVGSGQIPTNTTGDGGTTGGSVCGNSPSAPDSSTPGAGNPGSCSGIFQTIEEPRKVRTKRTEISTSNYGGIGKQISKVVKETYGAAVEVNPQYYADRFAYCRFNYATACNPNGSCKLEGLENILQLKTVETYTYDKAGTLVERNLEEWRPSLATAQPFDWRAGSIGGVPTSFTEISPKAIFRAKITNATYKTVGSSNIETITVFESSAVKSRAGIGATSTEFVTGGSLLLGKPTSYPTLSGNYSSLNVTSVTGSGFNMRVDVSYPETSGKVQQVAIQSSDYTNKFPSKDSFAGGSGTGFRATIRGNFSYSTGVPVVVGYNITIDNPGEGYSEGDQLTWTEAGAGGVNNTFVLNVIKTQKSEPSLNITSSGSGYKTGDSLKISAGDLSIASGQTVTSSINFSVVSSADSAVPGGNSIVSLQVERKPSTLVAGHYVNVPVSVNSGSGGGASVNIEAINTGIVSRAYAYQATGTSLADGYVASIGEYAFEDGEGSGTGLVLELGIGEYTSVGNLTPSLIVVRKIVKSGTGYQSGDVLTIPWQKIRDDFGIALQLNPRDTKITLTAKKGTIKVFPSSVGSNFSVGDKISVTTAVLQSIGAQRVAGVGIDLIVRMVSAENELGSLRLDAAEGIKTVTVNTSSSKSNLPDAPDTVASPSIATETVQTEVTVRANQYNSAGFSGPLVVEESVPVPLILSTRDQVQAAKNKYGEYLRRWYIGDALGLQIGEALTSKISSTWKPMAGFRYIDTTTEPPTGIAMRVDSCTWGVDSTEAVVSMNGIWCGNVVYSN